MESSDQNKKTTTCMFYNSGLKCPKGKDCPYAHSPEQKQRIQNLFEMGLYFKRKDKVLCPIKDAVTTFFDYITAQHICQNFYILGSCNFGTNCYYHHVVRSEQRNQLLPKAPIQKTDENSQKNPTEWQNQRCRYGVNCEKKNLGCLFSHDEEKKPEIVKKIEDGNSVKIEKEKSQKSENSLKSEEIDEDNTKSEHSKNSGTSSNNQKPKNDIIFKKQGKEKENIKNKENTNGKEKPKEKSSKKVAPKVEKSESESECSEEDVDLAESTTSEDEFLKDLSKSVTSGEDDVPKKVCQACNGKEKKQANCMFLPCGHQNYCVTCAQTILMNLNKQCSLCWKKVEYVNFKN